jgi:hypothetical protein
MEPSTKEVGANGAPRTITEGSPHLTIWRRPSVFRVSRSLRC